MAEQWSVRRLRGWMTAYLSDRRVESPSVCTDLLLASVFKCPRMELYMDADRPASAEELAALRECVKRAGSGEPVQYIVGSWSFYGCEIAVGPATLIPRPSTESLVDAALSVLRESAPADADSRPRRILDLCTGSGCIAIALARSLLASGGSRRHLAWSGTATAAPSSAGATDIRVIATEIVPEACALARQNAQSNGLSQWIEILDGDLDMPLAGRGLEDSFDVVCANPPYISDAEWVLVPKSVRDFEPESALRGGTDGLDVVRRVVACAPKWLRPRGSLLVEISFSQGPQALELARAAGLVEATLVKDLEGHQRVLMARRPA